MADRTLKQGDLGPSIYFQLREPDPNNPGQLRPVNLTSRTVTARMRLKGSAGPLKVDRLCTITDAPTGRGRFDWQGTDTDTLGTFVLEFRVASPQQTHPNDSYIVVQIIPGA